MHDEGVVHGDPKGVRFRTPSHCPPLSSPRSQANILINDSGNACWADFGLMTIASDRSDDTSLCDDGGSIRWMSPERLDPERFGLESRPTKESDYYALGMVIYEVLGGRAPFSGCKEVIVIRKIMNGERPGRPGEEKGRLFKDDIWEMLELCWKPKPEERISAETVLACLEGAPLPPQPPSDADGIVELDTDQSYAAGGDSSESFPSRPGRKLTSETPLWCNRFGDHAQ